MKLLKATYYRSGKIKIPRGYRKVLSKMPLMKGDYYLERKYVFIPKFKYNQEYKMPSASVSNEDFLKLLYDNCLLINEQDLVSKYKAPYDYYMAELNTRQNWEATPEGQGPFLESFEKPGIGRDELYNMFIDQAKELNNRVEEKEKNAPIFWKKSLGGKWDRPISSVALYIRKKTRFADYTKSKDARPNCDPETDKQSVWFDKPEPKVEAVQPEHNLSNVLRDAGATLIDTVTLSPSTSNPSET